VAKISSKRAVLSRVVLSPRRLRKSAKSRRSSTASVMVETISQLATLRKFRKVTDHWPVPGVRDSLPWPEEDPMKSYRKELTFHLPRRIAS